MPSLEVIAVIDPKDLLPEFWVVPKKANGKRGKVHAVIGRGTSGSGNGLAAHDIAQNTKPEGLWPWGKHAVRTTVAEFADGRECILCRQALDGEPLTGSV